jgi:hypothetical protein
MGRSLIYGHIIFYCFCDVFLSGWLCLIDSRSIDLLFLYLTAFAISTIHIAIAIIIAIAVFYWFKECWICVY